MPWAGLLNAGGATIQRRTSKKRCSSNAISMRRSLRYSSRNAAWPNAAALCVACLASVTSRKMAAPCGRPPMSNDMFVHLISRSVPSARSSVEVHRPVVPASCSAKCSSIA